MTDDRGQVLVVLVFVLALAAVALTGLRIAQDRLLSTTRLHRAGEAAVQAAAQSVADLYVTIAPGRPISELLADPRTIEAARVAAEDLAREHHAGAVREVEISCEAGQIHVRLELAGRRHRAGFDASQCSRH